MSRPYPQHALIALLALVLGGVAASPVRAAEPQAGTARANTASRADDGEQDRLRDLARRLADGEDEDQDSGEPSSSPAAPAHPATPESPDTPTAPGMPEAPSPSGNDAASSRTPDMPTSNGSTSSNADTPLGQSANPQSDNGNRFLGDRSGSDSDSRDFSDSVGSSYWILETLMALGVVIGLILLLRWAWLRLSGQPRAAASTPVVEVLSRTTVAPRNHVLLLRIGHRILIVGDSGSGMRTLANIEDEQEVADLLATISAAKDSSVTRNFQQLLGRFGTTHDQAVWDGEEDGRDSSEHFFDRARNNVSGLTSRIRTLSGRKGDDL